MRLHALVADAGTAAAAIRDGATVVQLRLKDRSSAEVVGRGRELRARCSWTGVDLVVNDDVEAALQLPADGVHLGQGDPGAERALAAGLTLGISASGVEEAVAAERLGASYVGAGPVWATPSKPDARGPIGLDGLAAIAAAVSIPAIAIGGVDATNAEACLTAGATGVAVIRAVAELRAVREAIDRAGR